MKKGNHLLLVLVVLILASCGATNIVPVTGRKQRINVNTQKEDENSLFAVRFSRFAVCRVCVFFVF